jgi:outer membrane lipoprotein-sorting protein
MANEEPPVLRSEFKVMRMSYRTVWALLPLILSGCLSHTRRLQQSDLLSPALKPDVAQLVETINRQYRQISSLTVTFDVTLSMATSDPGEQTDYTPCLGYLLFRKPYMLRVLVLVPVLHTHAMDMTSNGTSFTLLIPPRNRAIEGKNTVARTADDPLENLRPNVFVDTLMIHDILPDQIVSVIHESTLRENLHTRRLMEFPEYDLTVFNEVSRTLPSAPAQIAKPQRVIRFSQADLLPIGQDIYDADGNLETQVIYGPYRDFGGVTFPSAIDINRPFDKYRIRLSVNKLSANQSLPDDSFELKIPKGMQVREVV